MPDSDHRLLRGASLVVPNREACRRRFARDRVEAVRAAAGVRARGDPERLAVDERSGALCLEEHRTERSCERRAQGGADQLAREGSLRASPASIARWTPDADPNAITTSHGPSVTPDLRCDRRAYDDDRTFAGGAVRVQTAVGSPSEIEGEGVMSRRLVASEMCAG